MYSQGEVSDHCSEVSTGLNRKVAFTYLNFNQLQVEGRGLTARVLDQLSHDFL